MKIDVRPILSISNGNDVTAAAQVSWRSSDNELSVRVHESMVKDGLSTNGLSLGIRNDRFTCVYDVSNHAPRLRLNTNVNVRDRNVGLVYRRAIKENISSLEANLDVDDNNTAAIVYDLTSFERPDHKACLLKWTYRSGDYEVTPMYNLGTESLGVIGSYTIDGENRLRASYDLNSNLASIQWTNASGAGVGGGDLRITAKANLADANSAKQMPTLLVEKTWSMDV